MHCYGYKISFDHKMYKNQEGINLLKIDQIPSSNFDHELKFHNNQNREVKLLSNHKIGENKKDQKYIFVIKDLFSFLWSEDNSDLYYISHSNDDTLLKYWTLHTILPLYLTQKDIYYFLHAGAVEIENKPVLFIADSYGGKSTLTDFFIKKGHVMISDDKVATFEKDNSIYSVPAYPYHRPYRKTEDLGIFVENFASEKKEINSIFNLVKSDQKSEISIKEIFGIEKFKALRYATDIDLPINKQSRFKSISSIANKVEMYDITIPWDLDRLQEVYQTIIEFIKVKG